MQTDSSQKFIDPFILLPIQRTYSYKLIVFAMYNYANTVFSTIIVTRQLTIHKKETSNNHNNKTKTSMYCRYLKSAQLVCKVKLKLIIKDPVKT